MKGKSPSHCVFPGDHGAWPGHAAHFTSIVHIVSHSLPCRSCIETPVTLPYCCCSVSKSCPGLCDPTYCTLLGFPVLCYLPEFAQIHVHRVGGAIQLSHPLSPPSPPALNLFQHQGLFQQICSLHQVAKVSELQHQSFQFSRQEYSSGLPITSPGDLPDPGTKPTSLMSPALAGGFFTTSTTWEVQWICGHFFFLQQQV